MGGFEGVVPALPTPMGANGAFNEDVFRKVVEFNIDSGVHGFWVAGGTGESVLLEDEENKAVAKAVVDQSAGRAKIIMHVGAPTTDRAAKLAEHAAKVGADALCCVPPFFYRRTDEEIAEHYRIVAAAADLPLFVYNLPSATGVEITPGMMQTIQDRVPQLKGLKHSAVTFANIRTFANMGLSCFVGSHRLMLPAMTVGACGCVDGPLSVWPEIWVGIWKAYQAGDWKDAMTLQEQGSVAYEKLGAAGGPFQALIKAALSVRLDVDCGDLRPPGLPLSDEQRAHIRNLMTTV
ncbi:MAG: dihydrodipicolinate synthase family protein [Candidatus Latescibacteria bacterium]|jgi:dihydrodipicolinate synthase/N-acetylneuraminate lyase|nr:dihydrodipicolinate synthase family protein [Candidatus Latescibacterota bacterium]MBT4140931.1 dihydrodipicolinate synthase family protein [Candidatus Latescibacterota bacterium]